MIFKLLISIALLKFGASELISPCPDVFEYELHQDEPGRWYGTAKLVADQELSGVWIRVLLDGPSIQLGNWFGEVALRDNNLGYLIRSPEYSLKPHTPLEIKFYVEYNPENPPPKLLQLRLNGVVKCLAVTAADTTESTLVELFTSPSKKQ